MNSYRDVGRANWIALGGGMFLALGATLALIYVYWIAPELAQRAEQARLQRIAEVIERHGGSVEWIGTPYGGLGELLGWEDFQMELMPTASFDNPGADLFSSSKPRQPEKKTPALLIQRSSFKGSPELFAALAEFAPDTIYFNRTDFDSDDFAQLKGLQIRAFIASESLLDDRAADFLDCFGPLLEYAGLDYTFVGDKFIEKLCKTTTIMDVNLEGTRITSKCAEFLVNEPNLDDLNLANTDFDDEGLAQLAKSSSLRVLNVSHTKITADGLAKFKPPRSLVRIEVEGLEFPEEAYKWVIDQQIEVRGAKPIEKAPSK